MNMRQWQQERIESPKKKAVPVLSFPSIQLLGVTVKELIADADLQAEGMARVAGRCDTGASLSMMDLSVEAEAFGSRIRVTSNEVPTVLGRLVEDPDEAEELPVPAVGAGRTGLYIEALGKAKKLITDRPVLAGVIGPFSLAARLMGVSEAMINCYEEPDMVHTLMEKAVSFSIAYARAYRDAGADGIVMAEPASGLLSPALMEEFSTDYVKRIVDAVQRDDFAVVYHNCGSSVSKAAEQLAGLGAMAYHFGNSVTLADMLGQMPFDALVMGNVDPSGVLCHGTAEAVYAETSRVLTECGGYANFLPSSGCDIPPTTPWENIDAFFAAVKDFYAN